MRKNSRLSDSMLEAYLAPHKVLTPTELKVKPVGVNQDQDFLEIC